VPWRNCPSGDPPSKKIANNASVRPKNRWTLLA